MHQQVRVGLVFALLLLAMSNSSTSLAQVKASVDESEWTALPDDFSLNSSRNALFKDYVVASVPREGNIVEESLTELASSKSLWVSDARGF